MVSNEDTLQMPAILLKMLYLLSQNKNIAYNDRSTLVHAMMREATYLLRGCIFKVVEAQKRVCMLHIGILVGAEHCVSGQAHGLETFVWCLANEVALDKKGLRGFEQINALEEADGFHEAHEGRHRCDERRKECYLKRDSRLLAQIHAQQAQRVSVNNAARDRYDVGYNAAADRGKVVQHVAGHHLLRGERLDDCIWQLQLNAHRKALALRGRWCVPLIKKALRGLHLVGDVGDTLAQR